MIVCKLTRDGVIFVARTEMKHVLHKCNPTELMYGFSGIQ